jgi:hypothetical protein
MRLGPVPGYFYSFQVPFALFHTLHPYPLPLPLPLPLPVSCLCLLPLMTHIGFDVSLSLNSLNLAPFPNIPIENVISVRLSFHKPFTHLLLSFTYLSPCWRQNKPRELVLGINRFWIHPLHSFPPFSLQQTQKQRQ